MWKDPTLQPPKSKSSCGCGLWLDRQITDNDHVIGTEVGRVVVHTIGRLSELKREDLYLLVAELMSECYENKVCSHSFVH